MVEQAFCCSAPINKESRPVSTSLSTHKEFSGFLSLSACVESSVGLSRLLLHADRHSGGRGEGEEEEEAALRTIAHWADCVG